MRYEFSATFRLIPSSRVMKAESLPTRDIPSVLKGRVRFIDLSWKFNYCKFLHMLLTAFLTKMKFIVQVNGPFNILELLWTNLCLPLHYALFFFVNIYNSVSQFIDKILCTVLCIPTHISVSGPTRFRVCWYHIQGDQSNCNFFETHQMIASS